MVDSNIYIKIESVYSDNDKTSIGLCHRWKISIKNWILAAFEKLSVVLNRYMGYLIAG